MCLDWHTDICTKAQQPADLASPSIGHLYCFFLQEMFEQQNIAFGYFLRPDAAPEERVYQELPANAAQLAPLLENYLDTYNTRFNTNLNLGTPPFLGLCCPNTLACDQHNGCS